MKVNPDYIGVYCRISYKVVDKAGKALIDYSQNYINCFRRMLTDVPGNVPKTATQIILLPKVNNVRCTKPDVECYVKDINYMGFPCKYSGIKGDHYVIVVPLYNSKGKLCYKSKNHLFTALTALRYLFENTWDPLVEYYFDMCAAIGKKVNKFYAFQMAHSMVYGNGHSLHASYEYKFTVLQTKKEFITKLGKGIGVFGNGVTTINSCWNGKTLKINEPKTNYKTVYNMIVNNHEDPHKVFVVGGDINYANWLPNVKLVDTLEQCDVVLFTGGEDVHPSFYNEKQGLQTYCNYNRDFEEKRVYTLARYLNKKCLGICRGSQFLCVMAGGRLIQHQDNPLAIHPIKVVDGKELFITSTHHQAAYPFNLSTYNYSIIAWTEGLSAFHLDGEQKELPTGKECEIVYYRQANSLGIQGHPEFLSYQKDPKNAKSLIYLKDLFTKFANNKL